MKKLIMLGAMLFAFSLTTHAQTVVLSNAFTFGTLTHCGNIASWDGNSNAYPQDMGSICLDQIDPLTPGNGSFLDVPWQLGYLNNGYLAGCNPITWGTRTFSRGDGTHGGDAYTVAGTTACPYYTGEYGGDSSNLSVGWSVTVSHVMVMHRSCYHGRCTTYLVDTITGGTGEVTETRQ